MCFSIMQTARPVRSALLKRLGCFRYQSQKRFLTSNNRFFKVSEEIREALHARKPVVALETTIYTHGFPYPDNIALCSRLESVVRINGGIPATIGVLDGVAIVGLEAEELIRLTEASKDKKVRKISRRDLSFICGSNIRGIPLNGGTTVAGTAVLASLAGIKVFATGGLGGVHRGGEISMDVSADLVELGRTPITVISSGCKSFLDIPRTLEYLETQGVGVGTFSDGREGDVDFPAFWTRESGVKSPFTIQDEAEAASLIYAQTKLCLQSGLLLANPIPAKSSIPKSEIDAMIDEALRKANKAGISGSQTTPYILERIKDLTKGKSVEANKQLVEANVKRGTLVAVELARLESSDHPVLDRKLQSMLSILPDTANGDPNIFPVVTSKEKDTNVSPSPYSSSNRDMSGDAPDIIVAGSLAVDFACDYSPLPHSQSPKVPQAATSNPAVITQTIGGVGYNIALAISQLGPSVKLYSAVADDLCGRAALNDLKLQGFDTSGIEVMSTGSGLRTAQYVSVNDAKKDLVVAMADMQIIENLSETFSTKWEHRLLSFPPKLLVVDANWDPITLNKWLQAGKSCGAKVLFEPVSTAKATRLFLGPTASRSSNNTTYLGVAPNNTLSVATPNVYELASLHDAARQQEYFERDDWWNVIDSMGLSSSGSRDKLVQVVGSDLVDQGIPQQSIQLLPFIPHILTKLGKKGVLLTQLLRPEDPRLDYPETAPYILTRGYDNSVVGGVYMRLFPALEAVNESEVVSVNGAGDTLLGVIAAGMALNGRANVEDLIDLGQKGSILTLRSKKSVSEDLKMLKAQLNVSKTF